MKKSYKTVFLTGFLFLIALFNTPASAQTHTIEQVSVSGIQLSVYLPQGYDKKNNYRILYCNDGQSIFGNDGLNMDGIADDLIKRKLIEPLLIVGLHSGAERVSDYVPYEDDGAKKDFGDCIPAAESYTRKIVNKIIPFIEKK